MNSGCVYFLYVNILILVANLNIGSTHSPFGRLHLDRRKLKDLVYYNVNNPRLDCSALFQGNSASLSRRKKNFVNGYQISNNFSPSVRSNYLPPPIIYFMNTYPKPKLSFKTPLKPSIAQNLFGWLRRNNKSHILGFVPVLNQSFFNAIPHTPKKQKRLPNIIGTPKLVSNYLNKTTSPMTRLNSLKSSNAYKFVESTTSPSNNITSTKAYKKPVSTTVKEVHNQTVYDKFKEILDQLERKFYWSTYTKLAEISQAHRKVNGISFLQSGIFLYLILISLSTEQNLVARKEIDESLKFNMTDEVKIAFVKRAISWMPKTSDDLKFRWSTRWVLGAGVNTSRAFQDGAAAALRMRVDHFNGTETPEQIAKILNHMVEEDSGGALRYTFEEDEVSKGVCGVLLSTIYVRGRWRAAPTLLNGTWPFHDSTDPQAVPTRSTRMFRINDIMRYAKLFELNAEAVEISYATPGLSLLIVVPRGRSFATLAKNLATINVSSLTAHMVQLRAAVTLPLYTLRMTLLLPNKLEALGISNLVKAANETTCETLKLSHAVQRLMFWAEAGRYAFKDDGIEWDERPEIELVVDSPYVFYVRWNNVTLMNGNFVL